MSRLLTGAAATATLVASLAVASPAQAAGDARPSPTHPRATIAEAAPLPAITALSQREVLSRVVVRDGGLSLRGHVEDYRHGRVVIQRKACTSCSWKRKDVVLTSTRGRFHSRITAPPQGSDFWRAKVPASDGYARSFSAVWETYY